MCVQKDFIKMRREVQSVNNVSQVCLYTYQRHSLFSETVPVFSVFCCFFFVELACKSKT